MDLILLGAPVAQEREGGRDGERERQTPTNKQMDRKMSKWIETDGQSDK